MSTPKDRTKILAKGFVGITFFIIAIIVSRNIISDTMIHRYMYKDTIVVLNWLLVGFSVIMIPASGALFINLFRRIKEWIYLRSVNKNLDEAEATEMSGMV